MLGRGCITLGRERGSDSSGVSYGAAESDAGWARMTGARPSMHHARPRVRHRWPRVRHGRPSAGEADVAFAGLHGTLLAMGKSPARAGLFPFSIYKFRIPSLTCKCAN